MAGVNLSSGTASLVKTFYQKELAETIQKMRELKRVLAELEGVNVEEGDDLELGNIVSAYGTANDSEIIRPKATKKEKTPKSEATRKKKRGRKSFWPNFILSRLRATQVPLTYDDMANHAIAIKKLDITKFDQIRKTVIATAFVLRSRENKIDNYAIKGSRTKYMALPEWFEREGILLPEYRQKLR